MTTDSPLQLLEAAKKAHELLMGFYLSPQQMEIVCDLNEAINHATQAESRRTLLADPRVKEEMARAIGDLYVIADSYNDEIAQACLDALARMAEGV